MTDTPEATPEEAETAPDPAAAPTGPQRIPPAMMRQIQQVPQIPMEQAWRNIVTACRGFACNADQRDALNASLTRVAGVLQEAENQTAAQAEAPTG